MKPGEPIVKVARRPSLGVPPVRWRERPVSSPVGSAKQSRIFPLPLRLWVGKRHASPLPLWERVGERGHRTYLDQTKKIAIAMLLCLAAAQTYAAEELGRLLLTPAEREMLERLRNAPPPPPPLVGVEPPPVIETVPKEELLPTPSPPPPYVPPITVNGVVLRSRGEAMVWVNGQNTLEGDFSADNIRINRPRGTSVPIITPEHLPNVRLKPGQTYDPDTNTIVDVYQHSR